MPERRTETAPQQALAPRVASTPVEAMARVEIDAQIATAHHYPRSLAKCRSAAIAMATMDKDTAESCSYTLPRDNKQITGPSVRLAEILASTWTNLRVATRFVSEDRTHVTVEGVCHDLETNVAIAKEIRRRITSKNGQRYGDDMVMTTSNAAASIALRNAIVAVVPKAHWLPVYDAAMKVAAVDPRELPGRRAGMLSWFTGHGIAEAVLLKLLGKKSVAGIGLDDLLAAQGMRTAIMEQSTTVDELIASVEQSTGQSTEEMLETRMRKVPAADEEPEIVAEPVPEVVEEAKPEATQEPPEATAARELDKLRRKVLGIWANLSPEQRANVAKNVNLDKLRATEQLQKTSDHLLLQAVLETMPGA